MAQPNLEIPEPEGSDAKEVFAFFGLAAYGSQVLEQGVLHLAVAAKTADVPLVTRNLIDALYVSYDRFTLGQLVSLLREAAVGFPQRVESLLIESLERRNFLTHHFFERNAEAFMVDAGRERMIRELRSIVDLFQETDQAVTAIFYSLMTKFGLTEERVEAYMKNMSAALGEAGL